MSSVTNLRKIQGQIVRYSLGDFSSRLRFNNADNYWDAVGVSLNMLGEELREITVSKEFFLSIFDAVPDALLVIDNNGKIIGSNDAAGTMLGVEKDGSFNDYFFLRQHGNIFQHFRKVFRDINENFEQPLQLYNDPARHFICHFSAFHEKKNVQRYVALIKDVSDMVSATQRLADSERKFKQVFQNSSDGIILIDLRGRVLEMNQSMTALIDRQSKTGNLTIGTILRQPDTDKAFPAKVLLQGLSNKEVSLKTNDGLVHCLLSSAPVYESKKLVGCQLMIKNISQYKEYNNQLFRAVNELQEKERERIAGDLHDSVGQELIGIKYMINSMVKSVPDKSKQNLLKDISTSVADVIEQLRSISFALMPGTLQNFGIVNTIVEFMQRMNKIYAHVGFHFIPPAQPLILPPEMELHIYRMVQEFTNNSVKYSQCRNINITIDILKSKNMQIILSDDGKGFNLKDALSGSTRGLNNIISRSASCNGHVKMKSTESEGTTFIIKIPLKQTAA